MQRFDALQTWGQIIYWSSKDVDPMRPLHEIVVDVCRALRARDNADSLVPAAEHAALEPKRDPFVVRGYKIVQFVDRDHTIFAVFEGEPANAFERVLFFRNQTYSELTSRGHAAGFPQGRADCRPIIEFPIPGWIHQENALRGLV